MNLQESIRRILREEISQKGRDKLIKMIKTIGIKKTAKAVGGTDNLMKILNIDSPMKFLHLFDDLDVVQSEENPYFTLFRYEKGKNMMIYNKKNEDVYINYEEIWKPLIVVGLFNPDIQELTSEWLSNVYNLRGAKTVPLLGRPTMDAI